MPAVYQRGKNAAVKFTVKTNLCFSAFRLFNVVVKQRKNVMGSFLKINLSTTMHTSMKRSRPELLIDMVIF